MAKLTIRVYLEKYPDDVNRLGVINNEINSYITSYFQDINNHDENEILLIFDVYKISYMSSNDDSKHKLNLFSIIDDKNVEKMFKKKYISFFQKF